MPYDDPKIFEYIPMSGVFVEPTTVVGGNGSADDPAATFDFARGRDGNRTTT